MNRLYLLFLFLVINNCDKSALIIPTTDPNITYEGRIGEADDGASELYWSGTSVSLHFEGTAASVIWKEERGDNYYNVYVDGELVQLFRPNEELATYELVSGLEDTQHELTILKRTEYDRGIAWFYGFELPAGTEVYPDPTPEVRKIEYFGDSITAGYSTNDYETDRSDSIYTNYAESYANLIADHFDAQQHCTCKSGIGITISWFGYEMPDIWNLTNPFDPESAWDFDEYQPDLVIVNLFQNDSWLVNRPDHESFVDNFGDTKPAKDELIQAYADFVGDVRGKYPDAHIIATLGNMDITQDGSVWPGYVEEAIASLNDEKIHTIFTPFKETGGHPKTEEQKLIAENLIPFIEEKLGW